jgi:biopolymer transport protein TolQ
LLETRAAPARAVRTGIAEALFTTALGLFAAIPAAVAYSYFSHNLREMGARMTTFRSSSSISPSVLRD